MCFEKINVHVFAYFIVFISIKILVLLISYYLLFNYNFRANIKKPFSSYEIPHHSILKTKTHMLYKFTVQV